jgi:transposase
VVEQTLGNWVKLHRAGALKGVTGKSSVTAEQMEISRLRAELARVTMERDILGKATAFFAKGQKWSTPLFNTTSGSGRSGCSAAFWA